MNYDLNETQRAVLEALSYNCYLRAGRLEIEGLDTPKDKGAILRQLVARGLVRGRGAGAGREYRRARV